MTTEELQLAALEEEMDGVVRWVESDLPEAAVRLAKIVQKDVLELIAEVRRLRALLPPAAPVEAPRSVRPALEDIFPRVARFAPPGTTSA